MQVKYCNTICQKKHWATHKKDCKLRAAKLRDEALFKDPPPKEDCPICFIPMPTNLISCVPLPPATLSTLPFFDFANEHEELAKEPMDEYYPCCGKSICKGCVHSFAQSGNDDKCPFCNSSRDKTDEEDNEDLMKRAEANDAASICLLANFYQHGHHGLQQDHSKAMELYARAAELGWSKAHCYLAEVCDEGDMKKAKFHYEAAAMAGDEEASYNLGVMEAQAGNTERAIKHWTIAASAGCYRSMNNLLVYLKKGFVSRESIDSTLAAYNNSCVEFRSEARDACIQIMVEAAQPQL
jgi:tetratricopeptide (TPR) repeat protein